ncbi:hypothetical protein BpHYR1_041554 [Brachionus plicatilis]|uniref:CX domain-containing protein n=1 Tax=Brachionus plicatilis TaxID=10195 RepID=A0A3M7SRD6_BRAPC|nr:hypothetical protein BpHYR1_041554 [Brachionus plicatilis]
MNLKNNFLIIIIVCIILTVCNCLRTSGIRSGFRSGSRSTGSRSTSRSTSRVNIGSRYTSRVGSTSNTIFRFVRTGSSSSGIYRYGSYSGTRFGTSIRRSVFWPVRRVVYGTVFYRNHNNRVPPYSSSNVPNNIVISDTYTKIKNNETGFSYDCVAPGKQTITCFEPPENQNEVDMEKDPDLELFDGGCCENLSNGDAECCVIGINDDGSKAKILSHILGSLVCLIFTSLLLIRRCCR